MGIGGYIECNKERSRIVFIYPEIRYSALTKFMFYLYFIMVLSSWHSASTYRQQSKKYVLTASKPRLFSLKNKTVIKKPYHYGSFCNPSRIIKNRLRVLADTALFQFSLSSYDRRAVAIQWFALQPNLKSQFLQGQPH